MSAIYDIMRQHNHDDGVPDGAVIKKRVSRSEYCEYVQKLLVEAIDQKVAVGRAVDSPNLAQQSWMAALLNGIGYCNPKWEKRLFDEKMIKEQEAIRRDVAR